MNKIHTFVVLAYKESKFLEDCIKSVVNQSVKSEVLIATTTPNEYIYNIAKKYKLDVVEGKHINIGNDFDFALGCGKTDLVTIAHQDDLYDYNYTDEIIKAYKKNNDALIVFSDYYEIRNNKKVYSNLNLKIKRLLLLSLKIKKISGLRFVKRNSIRFGNSICCPAVTLVKNKYSKKIFSCDMKCNTDWLAWERLSNEKGKFIYVGKKLMGHRVDNSTTTTDVIKQGIRTEEDLYMFKKFWPNFIAKLITKGYKNSEKSNNLNS